MKRLSPCAVARLAGLAMACLVSVGYASNMGFLQSAPAGYFNDRDWTLLREAVGELLDNGKDGDTGSWKNEDNGHHGTLVLMNSYEAYGTTCRRARITNEAGDFRATSVRDFCKDEQGEWKILK